MKSILEALQNRKVLVSDGAWGTLLHKRGLQIGECPELWNITHRSDVLTIARSYIDAGADIILTNSFGGSPTKLKHYGLEDRCRELNEAAADISRTAAGSGRFVLGSIGPSGVMLLMGEVSEDTLYNDFCIQAEALKKGGVDAICIETMSAIDEAVIAIRAARESTGLEVACTFTFDKTVSGEFRTMMGVSPVEMTRAVRAAGASIIGSNCGNGFDQMIDVVKEIRSVDKTTPVLVHANAGKPVLKDGMTYFLETPEMMASKINSLVESGANIIGGCCGTTPEHIRAMVKVVKR